MKTKTIVTVFLACIGIASYAQDNGKEEPKGKAIVQVYGNFHTGFGSVNDDRGFELERSYIGYEYRLTDGISLKGVMDIGKSDDISDYHRIAYIKHAMISWTKGNLTLNGGLIPTTRFKFQEQFWGYRYVYKSFQDQYKFGSSADLGLSASYEFADWISADAIIVNGEGYKKIQAYDGLNYGLGITATPFKGFHIRIYGGLNESGEKDRTDIINMSAFAGYKCNRFSIGAEYAHILNAAGKSDADQYGYSVFASVKITGYADLYARFDDIYSKNGWNSTKDEQTALLGVQFKLGKYVKISPNVRVSRPKADGAKTCCYAYVNCSFGL